MNYHTYTIIQTYYKYLRRFKEYVHLIATEHGFDDPLEINNVIPRKMPSDVEIYTHNLDFVLKYNC